jgi:hypothetical protein
MGHGFLSPSDAGIVALCRLAATKPHIPIWFTTGLPTNRELIGIGQQKPVMVTYRSKPSGRILNRVRFRLGAGNDLPGFRNAAISSARVPGRSQYSARIPSHEPITLVGRQDVSNSEQTRPRPDISATLYFAVTILKP